MATLTAGAVAAADTGGFWGTSGFQSRFTSRAVRPRGARSAAGLLKRKECADARRFLAAKPPGNTFVMMR